MNDPPSPHDRNESIPWSRLHSDLENLLHIKVWRQRQQWTAWLTEHLSPISYVGFMAIAAEIVLEFVDASGMLARVSRGISALVFVVLIVLFGIKRAEHREQRRQQVFLRSAHLAVTSLDQLSFEATKPDEGRRSLDVCINKILEIILGTFAWRGSLNTNVMLPEDDHLVMKYVKVEPGVEYDGEFKPRLGEGGAGLCFQERSIVYFPRIDWKHGVQIKPPAKSGESPDLTVWLNLYRELEKKYERHYCSILCVPIAAYHQCFGVLNLDSKYPNPFSESDYLAVTFFGAIIAMALTKYQTVYG